MAGVWKMVVLLALSASATAQEQDNVEPRLEFKGDLRYRVEMIWNGDADLRYRHRLRARPAVHARVTDDLDAVVGLGTGGGDDPRSNNQSLDNGYSSKPIWLDLGYLSFHPAGVPSLNLLAGKMKNPLVRVGKTELLWDPDLNPEGVAMQLAHEVPLGDNAFEPFVNAGSFIVEERKDDDDTWQLASQAGVKLSLGAIDVLGGGRYVDLLHVQNMPLVYEADDGLGNSTRNRVDEDGNPYLAYRNDYRITGGFLEVGGEAGDLPWAVFGDVALNLAVDDDNLGWLAGALLGAGKKKGEFKIRYIYREVQSDAVYALFTDSDFNGGDTDGKGHELNLSYALHDQVALAATQFYNQAPISGPSKDLVDYHRTQLDVKMKF